LADDLNYPKAFKNLKQYDAKIGALTLELYNKVNDTLIDLIPNNSVGLREAQNKLMSEYDKALESTDFVKKFTASTVSTIVESSFLVNQPAPTKQALGDYLWRKSLFKDKVVLSTRIRNNSNLIVSSHRKALKTAMREGKTIAQIVGNIGDDTLKGFTRQLPKYIDDLKKAKIGGKALSQKSIQAVKRQAKLIKNAGLRADYLRLIDAIDLGKGIEKATFFAMERKTKLYANRVARSESLRAMAVARNHIAMQDPDTQLVKNVTQGNNPCNYCVAVEGLGFVPVENATLASHHPNCSCRPEYRRTIKRPKKWSNDTHNTRLQAEINKENKKSKSKGQPITYIKPESPVNLRTNDLYRNYPKS